MLYLYNRHEITLGQFGSVDGVRKPAVVAVAAEIVEDEKEDADLIAMRQRFEKLNA